MKLALKFPSVSEYPPPLDVGDVIVALTSGSPLDISKIFPETSTRCAFADQEKKRKMKIILPTAFININMVQCSFE